MDSRKEQRNRFSSGSDSDFVSLAVKFLAAVMRGEVSWQTLHDARRIIGEAIDTAELRAIKSGGNPNHDEHGRFASASSGGGDTIHPIAAKVRSEADQSLGELGAKVKASEDDVDVINSAIDDHTAKLEEIASHAITSAIADAKSKYGAVAKLGDHEALKEDIEAAAATASDHAYEHTGDSKDSIDTNHEDFSNDVHEAIHNYNAAIEAEAQQEEENHADKANEMHEEAVSEVDDLQAVHEEKAANIADAINEKMNTWEAKSQDMMDAIDEKNPDLSTGEFAKLMTDVNERLAKQGNPYRIEESTALPGTFSPVVNIASMEKIAAVANGKLEKQGNQYRIQVDEFGGISHELDAGAAKLAAGKIAEQYSKQMAKDGSPYAIGVSGDGTLAIRRATPAPDYISPRY